MGTLTPAASKWHYSAERQCQQSELVFNRQSFCVLWLHLEKCYLDTFVDHISHLIEENALMFIIKIFNPQFIGSMTLMSH